MCLRVCVHICVFVCQCAALATTYLATRVSNAVIALKTSLAMQPLDIALRGAHQVGRAACVTKVSMLQMLRTGSDEIETIKTKSTKSESLSVSNLLKCYYSLFNYS